MKFYIKQRIFSWNDRFSIYNDVGEEVYFVEGEIFSFGKRLHLMDAAGREMAVIHQKVFSFLPRFYVDRGERTVAEVVKNFTFFRQEYAVQPMGWCVTGDFWAHEYSITDGEHEIARISKDWFTWGDAYSIDVGTGEDAALVLSVVLVIDAVLEMMED